MPCNCSASKRINKPLIVGLNSKRGKSGKDTLFDTLSEWTDAVRFAFGDELKKECSQVIGVSPLAKSLLLEDMHDQSRKDVPQLILSGGKLPYSDYKAWLMVNDFDMTKPRSVRFHLQQYGNGFVRDWQKRPTAWLDKVHTKVEGEVFDPTPQYIIITDCRQENEAAWIKSTGGIVIEIQRDWIIPELDNSEPHVTDLLAERIEMPKITNIYGDRKALLHQFMEVVSEHQR